MLTDQSVVGGFSVEAPSFQICLGLHQADKNEPVSHARLLSPSPLCTPSIFYQRFIKFQLIYQLSGTTVPIPQAFPTVKSLWKQLWSLPFGQGPAYHSPKDKLDPCLPESSPLLYAFPWLCLYDSGRVQTSKTLSPPSLKIFTI